MRHARKGNQWYFGTKAHIGVDAASGLVHTVVGTSANVSDINVAGALLHGEEYAAFGDSGYQGVHKRAEAAGPTWHVAMRPGKRRLLNPFIEPEFVAERVEKMKASIRAKVEHSFRVIKQQFGFTKVRYRGLAKNTAQIVTLFALSNLYGAAQVDGGQGMSAFARPESGLQGGRSGCHKQQIIADLARSGHLAAATSPCSFRRDCRTRSADHP